MTKEPTKKDLGHYSRAEVLRFAQDDNLGYIPSLTDARRLSSSVTTFFGSGA